MIGLILLAFVILLCFSSLFRCIVFNLHNTVYFAVWDFVSYLKNKDWEKFSYFGIDMFVGMFGHGKTLSMTHKARKLYKKYGNTIQFISNYKLIGIPYIPLINFNQLVELGEDKSRYLEEGESVPPWYLDDNGNVLKEYKKRVKVGSDDEGNPIFEPRILRPVYQGTVVLIDEIEDVLSHRNYANFPLQLLSTLTQQRKKHVYIMCSAQRFFMVDKLFRAITTHVIDCNKYWRLQHMVYYDAWDYEQAMNTQLVKSMGNYWWFVHNKDFDCYNTEQMISKNMAEDFISNEESIVRRGLDATVNEQAVSRPSKKLKKSRKRK